MTPASTRPDAFTDTATPQQRLDTSRKRLINFMAQGEESVSSPDTPHGNSTNYSTGNRSDSSKSQPKNAALQTLTRTARAWWRHHPAKLALQIAEPVLDKYAQDKPFQLLGIAAATGAAIVLVRPWRLVSVTGLLLTTLKSSGLANVALSLVSGQPRQSPPRQDNDTG